MPTISSSRVQPLVTPSTALLTSARASPCTADCESFSRIATRCPSCCSMRMPRGNCVSSLPFGPCTATVLPSIFTVTPLGSAIGFLPILDISYQLSAISFQPGQHRRLVVVAVLQIDPQDLMAVVFGGLKVGDVALFLQNTGNLQLQLGSGNIHFLVPGADRIANTRQHVCDRIGQPHRLLLLRRPF